MKNYLALNPNQSYKATLIIESKGNVVSIQIKTCDELASLYSEDTNPDDMLEVPVSFNLMDKVKCFLENELDITSNSEQIQSAFLN